MITHPGIGRYISCLLSELIKQAPEDKFTLFGDPGRLESFSHADNVQVAKWNVPIYSAWEQLFAFYSPMDIDLFHVPHFNIPLLLKKKMVVTIHDLISYTRKMVYHNSMSSKPIEICDRLHFFASSAVICEYLSHSAQS